MGKKKRSHPDIEEILARPWCYYCERDFDDLKILISHQKAKHYKCDRCNRRLNTAGGLSVHLNQVHKENLTQVDNALPNRAGPDIEIFGMEGIPEDILQAHNQRISHEFFAAEAQRRAISGNHGPSGGPGNNSGSNNAAGGSAVKKAKFESPAELKKRLAEHKAKKAAAEAAGGSAVSSDPNTPAQTNTPPPTGPMHHMGVGIPPSASPAQQGFPHGYGQPPVAVPPQAPAPFYGAQQSPPYNYADPYGAAPPVPLPGAYPPGQFAPQPHFPPAPQQYSDPAAGFPAPYQPQQQYQQPPPMAMPMPMPHHPPHSASPFNQYNQRPPSQPQPQPQPQTQAQPQPQRPLAAAPGLPQRPSFNAPHVSREQLAEMHHGSLNAAGEPQPSQPATHPASNGNAQSVDDLISNAAQQSIQAPATLPASAAPRAQASTPVPATAAPVEKKAEPESKKAKKPTRLVYPEQDASPEEKLASLPMYDYTPDNRPETIRVPIDEAEGNVTGSVQDSDTVLDPSG